MTRQLTPEEIAREIEILEHDEAVLRLQYAQLAGNDFRKPMPLTARIIIIALQEKPLTMKQLSVLMGTTDQIVNQRLRYLRRNKLVMRVSHGLYAVRKQAN